MKVQSCSSRRLAAAGFAACAALVMAGALGAATTTVDLTTQTAAQVAQTLVGAGVTISNVTFTGATVAGGTFSGGTGIIGFESGVILSSGNIAGSSGPNNADNTTTINGAPGDGDLNALAAPFTTQDAAVLEFDFVPDADTIFFRYVFGSEEYNEFVNSIFNDVFGFYVNGVNCATVPRPGGGVLPVSVNSINNGNPFGAGTITNPALYRNNDLNDPGATIDTEMDGLTTVLTCTAPVTPNATNHMKLAIADTSDTILDSVVFIEQGSLSTVPPGGTKKTGVTLTTKLGSPQPAGTAIGLVAAGTGGVAPYEYRFWIQPWGGEWQVVRDWGQGDFYAWQPMTDGGFNLTVEARSQGGTAAEAQYSIGFLITPGGAGPMTSVTLTPDLPSTQRAGTTIKWRAEGQGGRLPYAYRYWVQPWGGAWEIVTDWSSATRYAWTPTTPGGYNVAVEARGAGSAAGEVSSSVGFFITP